MGNQHNPDGIYRPPGAPSQYYPTKPYDRFVPTIKRRDEPITEDQIVEPDLEIPDHPWQDYRNDYPGSEHH